MLGRGFISPKFVWWPPRLLAAKRRSPHESVDHPSVPARHAGGRPPSCSSAPTPVAILLVIHYLAGGFSNEEFNSRRHCLRLPSGSEWRRNLHAAVGVDRQWNECRKRMDVPTRCRQQRV